MVGLPIPIARLSFRFDVLQFPAGSRPLLKKERACLELPRFAEKRNHRVVRRRGRVSNVGELEY